MWHCLGLTSRLIKNIEPMNCWRTRPSPEVRRTHYSWVMLVAVACSSLGCGGEVVGVGSVTVKITPDVALAVGVGQTIDFNVTVNTMSSDISGDGRVFWSVDNVQIASIDENGVATAVSPGVTQVMVTVDGQNDMAVLEVYVPELVTEYETGTSYRGRSDYVEYIPGDLPVILSAAHGGGLTPAEINDRTWGVTVTDRNTTELTLAVRDAFFDQTGHTPHVIISHLSRVKLDPNREIIEAAQGNVFAEHAWEEFQGFIEVARKTVTSDFGGGMYFDMHGHGHPIGRLELGYLLSISMLNQPDTALNNLTTAEMTSIRAIGFDSPISFSKLLRGPTSFGGYLETEGIRAVPSPGDPSPGTDPYFIGGYNTHRHGSIEANEVVSGIQIEHHFRGIRDSNQNRRSYATRLATTIQLFLLQHFGFFEPSV